MYNITAEYIKHTKKFLENFMRLYFQKSYNAKISKQYIETYLTARYENYGGDEKQRIFYRRIYSALKTTCERIQYEAEEAILGKIRNMLDIYQYIFYIDFVRPLNSDLKDFTNLLCEKRVSKFNLEDDAKIKDELYKMIKKYRDEKEKYLNSFDSSDFELLINKYPLVKDLYKVNLKYNFSLPYIFSDKAIEEVYNENVINEDKLIILYTMLSIYNIKMINEGNFNMLYLLDFPITVLAKDVKKDQILKILSTPALQDRSILKIKYKDFEKNKEEIYEFMQNGYKFAVILDDTFVVNKENVKKLNIFKYVIVDKKLEKYDELENFRKDMEDIRIEG